MDASHLLDVIVVSARFSCGFTAWRGVWPRVCS